MMIPCFRILFLLVFSLYWGGLTFYTGFVVRVAHDVLNDPMDGGLITQRVTLLIQGLGVVCVLLMAVNGLMVMRNAPKLGISLMVCAIILGGSLVGLFIVHGHLDAVIDVEASEIIDRDAFTIGHRRYNQLTTIQWLATLTYLLVTVFAWRRIDATSVTGNGAQ